MNVWDFCNSFDICLEQEQSQKSYDEQQLGQVPKRHKLTPLELKNVDQQCKAKTLQNQDLLNSRRSLRRQRNSKQTPKQQRKVQEEKKFTKNAIKMYQQTDQKRYIPLKKIKSQNAYEEAIKYQTMNAVAHQETLQKNQNCQEPISNLRVTISYSNNKQSPMTSCSEKQLGNRYLFKSFQKTNDQTQKQISTLNGQDNLVNSQINMPPPKTSKKPTLQNLQGKRNLWQKKTIKLRHAETILQSEASSQTSEVIQSYKNLYLSHLISRQSTSPPKKKSSQKKTYRIDI